MRLLVLMLRYQIHMHEISQLSNRVVSNQKLWRGQLIKQQTLKLDLKHSRHFSIKFIKQRCAFSPFINPHSYRVCQKKWPQILNDNNSRFIIQIFS